MIRTLVTFALLAGSLGAAWAAGENTLLRGTPMARFTAEDVALMKDTVRQALKSPDDGATLSWANDKTGASGSATPVDRHTWNELPCRRVRIVNVRGRSTDEGVYRFCEKPAGRWKLAGPDRAPR